MCVFGWHRPVPARRCGQGQPREQGTAALPLRHGGRRAGDCPCATAPDDWRRRFRRRHLQKRRGVARNPLIGTTGSTYELCRSACAPPVPPGQLAARWAAIAGQVFALLLVPRLCTWRGAGAAGHAREIGVVVYRDAWPTLLSWAALSLTLVAKGGGRRAWVGW
jgi:hypothetical protein